MKISIVVGGNFVPTVVDDPNIKHDSFLVLQDEYRNYKFVLGLDRDKKLSQDYMPYWSRVLSFEELIYVRDEISRFIDLIQKDNK